jgi:adenylate cyclase
MFSISPKQKRNISRILPFGIICYFFGIIYVLLEKSLLGNLEFYPVTGITYEFSNNIITTGFGSLIMGLIIGSIEVLFINKYFVKRAFGIKLLFKTILYIILLTLFLIFLTLITNSSISKVSMFDPVVLESVVNFMSNLSFWFVIIYMGAVTFIMLFFSEVSDNLGQGVLKNFMIGKYHHPREEERIFMFLDMKSSTTIAEKLGHIRYYKLLNEYYADITKAIIETSGEIYQYVGDEIVVSWKLKEGVQNNDCVQCFFDIKKIFKDVSEKYTNEYGLVPGFKAGFHYGKVTTGEIGVIKKEIIFTGDVLNTTARIQSRCNEFDVDILLSEDLVSLLDLKNEYGLKEIGECELRGRETKIKLLTIEVK